MHTYSSAVFSQLTVFEGKTVLNGIILNTVLKIFQ